ncbi:aminotransferase class V-fold PLP-dependent enzyme [Flavihumibacter fluvii]|uniref:aminotransferase class V-fold PLP-dependent enzyme n=1 Tax=Flavihumibacter fluvii TaxID=2838157 RepID=UPI001BDEFDA8|nr:aminotransferase class V-fold PLP-dependent enzyme [Flavihumibacter fluvii]ULQ50728.1 aminotransferase class V-fold PLP-dependent enzyme [Flavihumibacter fluvii]
MKRRDILKSISILPLAGGLAGSLAPVSGIFAAPKAKRNVFEELGLRTFINAAGNYTAMSASLMPPEVMEAINQSATEYVMLDEVQDKVGEKIAAMCHAEAAMVTAGCWSAIVLGTAGVLTGKDNEKIKRLPNLTGSGMKSEVIIQKAHLVGYEHSVTNTGAKIIVVETADDAEKAINDKTAMMWFLNREAPLGKISHEAWLQIAKKHNIPTMIDMAADVPPVENLWKYNDMGFDLVAISGGKAMCGPQSTGILMGKKELIAAARLNGPPNGGNIGRGMKVNKEEIIGMYVAMDAYIKRDHRKEWKTWEDKIAFIDAAIKKIPGVTTEVFIPPVANHNPSLMIAWDPQKIKLTKETMGEKLRRGSPSIETISWEKDNSIRITVFMLKPGQEKMVANRIKEELLNNSAS